VEDKHVDLVVLWYCRRSARYGGGLVFLEDGVDVMHNCSPCYFTFSSVLWLGVCSWQKMTFGMAVIKYRSPKLL